MAAALVEAQISVAKATNNSIIYDIERGTNDRGPEKSTAEIF